MELASQCQLTRRDDTLKLANMIGRDLSAATQITGHDIALEPQVRRTAPGVRLRRVRGDPRARRRPRRPLGARDRYLRM